MANVFHYAFKVKDLTSTRRFYIEILGCKEGRSTDTWVDFDFWGNQLSAHVAEMPNALDYCGKVDGIDVPIPHFGAVLNPQQFETTRQQLEQADIEFIVKPIQRYEGQAGQQQTMFVLDFSGNPLEFKSFTDQAELFS
ncbi:VOC family protein [Aliamphritea ceti]|uniref:VOC family protein n=1 Tax=Aliamphritea ceti TaxID=1524258 RepID=UPI0021C46A8E|nr:VOC family protein [Aliamphritea ceti]